MKPNQNFISKLIVIDLNDTIIITPKYSAGVSFIDYVKLNKEFDWGEIKIEYSNLNFKSVRVILKEFNKNSKEPATTIIEKLLLLENYKTDKNIVLLLQPVNDIVANTIFYNYLLKNTLYISDVNNLNIDLVEQNDYVISKFKLYLNEYYPKLIDDDYLNAINYFKDTLCQSDGGYSIFPSFDNTLSNIISSYIKHDSQSWVDLVYTNYIKYTHPIYSLYTKLNSKQNTINISTLQQFIKTYTDSNIINNIKKFQLSNELKTYIINSSIKNTDVVKNIEYLRDVKLYQNINKEVIKDFNPGPWCPIFLIRTPAGLTMSTTKIASTWLINNYYTKNNKPTNDYNRDKFSFNLNNSYTDVSCEYQETSDVTLRNYKEDIKQQYNNIITNQDNNNTDLYILYRDPFERYLQSLYQDISNYLNELYIRIDRDGILVLYSYFIKVSPNYDILLEQLYKISDTHSLTNLADLFSIYKSNKHFNEMISLIIDGVLTSFFNPDVITDKNRISPSNTNLYIYDVLTPHYTNYLTNVLDLYNKITINDRIKFINIDKVDIGSLLLNTTENIKTVNDNITPIDFKKLWKTQFNILLNNNDSIATKITKTLNSDIIAYNTIEKFQKNTTSSNLSDSVYYINTNIPVILGELNNNIVIAAQKIASSWLIQKLSSSSSLLDWDLVDDETYDILMKEYRNSFDNAYNVNSNKFIGKDISNEEIKIINKSTHRLLSDITSKKINRNIYILYRHPETRYIQAIYEDVNTYLQGLSSDSLLNFYLSFIKNTPTETYQIYKKMILNMTNAKSYGMGGMFGLNRYFNHKMTKETPGSKTHKDLGLLYKIIIDGIMNWFVNGFDYTSYDINTPFMETLKNENDINHDPIRFRNYITQHYTAYLNPMLSYYNNLNQPSFIKFLDIDVDNIDNIILGDSDKLVDSSPVNSSPKLIKNIWKNSFINYMKNNMHFNNQVSKHLLPDIIAYNTIKNIKK